MPREPQPMFFLLQGDEVRVAESIFDFGLPADTRIATVFEVFTKRTMRIFVEQVAGAENTGPSRWNFNLRNSGDLLMQFRPSNPRDPEEQTFVTAIAAGTWTVVTRGGMEYITASDEAE